MSGGTFTISNLGMFGVASLTRFSPARVGILAVSAAEKRPVVVGDALTIGTVMTVTLTADHRASMARWRLSSPYPEGLLEEPAAMLL